LPVAHNSRDTTRPSCRSRRSRTIASAALGVVVLVLAVMGALLGAATAVGAQSGGPSWPILVANYKAGTVTDIGPTWTTTIVTGAGATAVAITPDGRYAYVTNAEANTVSVIAEPATADAHVMTTLAVGGRPDGITLTPDGAYAYVTDYRSSKVSLIDGADSGAPTVSPTTLSVGSKPSAIAVTPDGRYAYVANLGSGTVSVIDGADSPGPTVAGTLRVGRGAEYIALTPDGRYGYVTDFRSHSVSVIDGADSPGPTVSPRVLEVGDEPSAVAIAPDGDYAYVTDEGAGEISVIDNADSPHPVVSKSVLGVGSRPDDDVISPDGNVLYAVDFGSGALSVITGVDSPQPAVAATVPAVSGGWAAAVVPDQAPEAALSAVSGQGGQPTTFDASASRVAIGTIVSYSWSFGDGTEETTTTPTTTHTYRALGTYTATVTETDSAGTSASQLGDGVAMLQNGGPSAVARVSITIATLCPLGADVVPGSSGCALSADLAVSPGTLSLAGPSELYWDDVLSGYGQWETASVAALAGCSEAGAATTCNGGALEGLEVVDATGSGDGWALTEYLTSSDLPSGSLLDFAGAASTPGDSTVAPLTSFPYSATTVGTVCDLGAACTPASAPTSCSVLSGFACPSYPVQLPTATGPLNQVELFSATPGSGMGAVCLGTGAASAAGCAGITPRGVFVLGLPAYAEAATDASTVINLTVSSGP
jgi:YVTN family beta-propeller protein